MEELGGGASWRRGHLSRDLKIDFRGGEKKEGTKEKAGAKAG